MLRNICKASRCCSSMFDIIDKIKRFYKQIIAILAFIFLLGLCSQIMLSSSYFIARQIVKQRNLQPELNVAHNLNYQQLQQAKSIFETAIKSNIKLVFNNTPGGGDIFITDQFSVVQDSELFLSFSERFVATIKGSKALLNHKIIAISNNGYTYYICIINGTKYQELTENILVTIVNSLS